MRSKVLNKFNRGEIDTLAMPREDVAKVVDSCELMTNFLPMRLGPMVYRQGTTYLGTMPTANYTMPFVASITDTAVLELTTTALRVWVDGALVSRDTSALTLSNEEFTSDIASWTDSSGSGSSTAWSSDHGGSASIVGSGTTSGKLYQTFGNSGTYLGLEHGITITVFEAPVKVQIGQSGVDSSDIFEGTLSVGTHKLVIIPDTGLPTITLSNSAKYRTRVGEVSIDSSGTMSVPLPDTITDIRSVRFTQSADVVYVATSNTQQFQIERRGVKSWSIVEYRSNDGPFGLINNSDTTLAVSGLSANPTLTASAGIFTSASVGELYKLTSSGQIVSASVTAEDSGTNSIRVTGVGDTRKFTVIHVGTFTATVTLQRSSDNSVWNDVETYTASGSKTYDDALDNSILYYRLRVKTGDYTSGTVSLTLSYDSGSIDGVCRVVSYTSSTVVTVQVLEEFGSTDATRDWYRGEWSDTLGYPTSVSLYEARLWWGGKTKLWGSVSDQYSSFDDSLEGDSRAIRRTIGFGPVDSISWLAPSSRLIMGIATNEISVRSSSFGEVLSNSNINLKSGSNRGVANIEPVELDDALLYVQRSGTKLVNIGYNADGDNHVGYDLMILTPRICKGAGGIVRLAISREPETRVYVVMGDGSMRVWMSEGSEDVTAWSRITTDGTFEDVIVLPGTDEDAVYVVVSRTGGRYLERFADIADAVTEHFDSAVTYTSPGTTITGLSHLDGKTVGVWADNEDRGTYTVASGQITVASSWTNVVVGLPHVAQYKSMKVSNYIDAPVTSKRKRVVNTALVMEDYWPGSVTIGPAFDNLKPMPQVEYGYDLTAMVDDYDTLSFEFDGDMTPDPRICLQATGPCTIKALTYEVLQDGDPGNQKG